MPESKTPPEQARVPTPDSGVPAVAVTTPTGPGTEGTISGTIVEVGREHIRLDIDGDPAKIYASELMLDIGEQPADRYALGQTFSMFVFQMAPDPDSGATQYSIRRAADYLERLAALKEGSVVTGTVVQTYDIGIEIDVDGLRGNCVGEEIGLPVGQSPHNHFKPGDTAEVLVLDIFYGNRDLSLSLRRNQPDYLESFERFRARFSVGDIVTATASITFVSDNGIELDVNGVVGGVPPSELVLDPGQSITDRYSVGDTVEAFVWLISPTERSLILSLKRNQPDYLESFERFSTGEIVTTTVTSVFNNAIELDVDGVIGLAYSDELMLDPGQTIADRYSVGDTVEAFVWSISPTDRGLLLSLKRNQPDYLESLERFNTGDIVTTTVTSVFNNAIKLVGDGVIGLAYSAELLLDPGQTIADRYFVGDTVEAFVLRSGLTGGDLMLSLKRNQPGYLDAFNRFSIGDVVHQASVTHVSDYGYGIVLDVNGVNGWINADELPLADGQEPADLYSVGDHLSNLFVWRINNDRSISLSVRRNAPGYMDRLEAHNIGDVVTGIVTRALLDSIWVRVNGIIGWIDTRELLLSDGETAIDRYADGDIVEVLIYMRDLKSRHLLLSVRRNAPDYIEEPISHGMTINVVFSELVPGGVMVLAEGHKVFIPHHELALSPGGNPQLGILSTSDDPRHDTLVTLSAVVITTSLQGIPLALSHRRALQGYADEVKKLTPGTVIPNAVVIPEAATLDDEHRVAVDLGPITGFIQEEELNPDAAVEFIKFEANNKHGVVIESVDHKEGYAIVSREGFNIRWQRLAINLSEGSECDGILKQIMKSTALFDLGFGLLGEMPWEPRPSAPAMVTFEDIGKTVPVRVTAIDRTEHFIRLEHRDQEIHQLITGGESQSLEFKASLRRSPRSREDDPNASYGVLKSIVGFLNSWDGGTLIIGVDDTGNPIVDGEGKTNISAMEIDGYRNEDEMLRSLRDQIKKRIAISAFELLDISFVHYRDIRVIHVNCSPAEEATWLKGGRSGKSKQQEFFLRTPAATDPLEGRDLVEFVTQRFGGGERP